MLQVLQLVYKLIGMSDGWRTAFKSAKKRKKVIVSISGYLLDYTTDRKTWFLQLLYIYKVLS